MSTPKPGTHRNPATGKVSKCTASLRPCLYIKREPKPEVNKKSKVTRSDTHEFLVAEAILQLGENVTFSTDTNQVRLRNKRENNMKLLNAAELADIQAKVAVTVRTLPKPQKNSTVSFVESSQNQSEVYDVKYVDVNGAVAKVSCKLAEVEDKAYRFSTAKHQMEAIQQYNRDIFSESDKLTYREVLENQQMTVGEYQTGLLTRISHILENDTTSDYKTLVDLTRQSFIGNGRYHKTLADGTTIFYPAVNPTDTIKVDQTFTSHSPTATSLVYRVDMFDESGKLKQKYEIRLRVKFKDGVDKPVSFTKTGLLHNIAATVQVKLL